MIFKNSRYSDGYTSDVMLLTPEGTQRRTVLRRPAPSGAADVVHYVWRSGDRIDRVAQRFLRDPQKYWRILDLNPEILNPSDIAPGTVIRIPNA